MAWSRRRRVALDFNPTFFAHPKANAGFTLSSTDPAVRKFWVKHCLASRRIAEAMAKNQRGPCIDQSLDSRRGEGFSGRPLDAPRAAYPVVRPGDRE
jgi:L-rhamnose isomerase